MFCHEYLHIYLECLLHYHQKGLVFVFDTNELRTASFFEIVPSELQFFNSIPVEVAGVVVLMNEKLVAPKG